MKIDPGRLNRRVTIERLVSGQDAIGQPVQTWSVLATVWAEIKTQSGIETVKADAQMSTTKAVIRMRWRTDINAGMRVVHGATAYNIQDVLPDMQDRKHIELPCEVVR